MTSVQKIIKYCAMALAIFLTVSIIGGIIGVLSSLTSVFGGVDEPGEMKTYTINDTVTNLDIDISAAELEINTGEAFLLESNCAYLTVKEDNGTVMISEKKRGWNISKNNAKVILTVPEGHIFEDADIVTGAGRVSIDSLSSGTLVLELGAGEVRIEELSASKKATIDGGAGRLTINSGAIHDLQLNMGVGELNLTSALTGDCKLDYGIGAANLTLIGSENDYRIKLDKGIGDATLDGKAMDDGGVYGTGDNDIDIDGGIGSIRISFTPPDES